MNTIPTPEMYSITPSTESRDRYGKDIQLTVNIECPRPQQLDDTVTISAKVYICSRVYAYNYLTQNAGNYELRCLKALFCYSCNAPKTRIR